MEPVRIPITPELHRNRRRVVVVSVAVFVVTVLLFLGLSLNTVGTVNVMGIEVEIHYTGPGQLYFGNSVQNFTWNIKTLNSGEDFHFDLKIINSGDIAHSVDSIGVGTSGFKLVSTGEPIPLTLDPHTGQSLILTIESPRQGYVGEMVINILAT